jgi:hypothetical protein
MYYAYNAQLDANLVLIILLASPVWRVIYLKLVHALRNAHHNIFILMPPVVFFSVQLDTIITVVNANCRIIPSRLVVPR